MASLVIGDGSMTLAQSPHAKPAQPSPPAAQIFPSDLLWTIDITAKPLTSPSASGDRLFIALESGISARKIADGSEIWNKRIAVDGPMAVAGDRLIAASTGQVYGLATETGDTVWSELIGPLTAPPAVAGDVVFLATGKQLSAHRVADGSRAWTREVGVVEQRPVVDANRVYVPVSDGKMVALDLASGDVIWDIDVGINPTEPLVSGDRVYFGTAAKKFCSVRTTREEDWCFPIGAAVVGAPVTDGARVYFVALDNQLYALDRGSGNRRWKQDLRYRPSAGPSIVGTTVSAPGREAKLQAFDVVKGTPGAALTLPALMVEVPVFIPAADGAPVKFAALAGGLENVWKLTLAWPPPPRPAVPQVAPLTELPGRPVPIPATKALP
ncbi:MAG TPA: PQQ-binding-like beta-propeller repeat protein [Vicinamibacterales bacterium]